MRQSAACTVLIVVMASLLVLPAFGEMYRCIDERGKSHISNTPCYQDTQEVFSEQSSTGDGRRLHHEVLRPQPQTGEPRVDGQPSAELIAACVDKYREHLKDPQSPYVYKATVTGQKLILDARAKNSFGGYVPTRLTCPLLSNNAIDEKELAVYLAAFSLGIPLKR